MGDNRFFLRSWNILLFVVKGFFTVVLFLVVRSFRNGSRVVIKR